MEKLRKDLDKKVKHYDEALKAIPSGWDMIGQDFVEGKYRLLIGWHLTQWQYSSLIGCWVDSWHCMTNTNLLLDKSNSIKSIKIFFLGFATTANGVLGSLGQALTFKLNPASGVASMIEL